MQLIGNRLQTYTHGMLTFALPPADLRGAQIAIDHGHEYVVLFLGELIQANRDDLLTLAGQDWLLDFAGDALTQPTEYLPGSLAAATSALSGLTRGELDALGGFSTADLVS